MKERNKRGIASIKIDKITTSPAKKLIKNRIKAVSTLTSQFLINNSQPFFREAMNFSLFMTEKAMAYLIIKVAAIAVGTKIIKRTKHKRLEVIEEVKSKGNPIIPKSKNIKIFAVILNPKTGQNLLAPRFNSFLILFSPFSLFMAAAEL